ncbi:4-alpha-glucanotransferase, partial [Streptomyces sp. UNOB3_S3]|uniref:4-alpha-glucanotransferase n=1 Tax=Streptomyces sp. UNOB3_S3 TaxID=2871682 RepID=UPI001E30BE1B
MDRARLAGLHGVATSYETAPGSVVRVPEDTLVAVLAALGVDASTPRAVRAALEAREQAGRGRLLPPAVVLRGRAGAPPPLPRGTALTVETEDGATLPWGADGSADGDADGGSRGGAEPLPYGAHVLRARTPDGRSASAPLIVAPERLPTPPERGHGFLVQLYSLLSARSWGMGDLGDLADLAAWAGRSAGSDFLQVNPLHAAVPGPPTDPSPYRP